MDETTQSVHIGLSERAYDIEIGSGSLATLASFVSARRQAKHALIVTDENVLDPYANQAAESLSDEANVDILVVPPGESSKSVETADVLWEQMLELGTDRKSLVVAVGGGVVGDLAGFIAATYARGLAFFQVPTTLLAQVDSSVGGKVGINLPGAKNMVGAFWQPAGVLIDIDALSTLPDREYRAGLAEVIKYGVILDAAFFQYLEQHVEALNDRDAEVMRYVVARCCRLKADVVEEDEREETGLRAVLNFGHTFCHAFEAATGYEQLLHGEAVAIGMGCAARLAERLDRVDAEFTERLESLTLKLGLPTQVPDVPHDTLIDLMQRDKKVEHGRLRFVLPTRMGHVELVGDVPREDVVQSLRAD